MFVNVSFFVEKKINNKWFTIGIREEKVNEEEIFNKLIKPEWEDENTRVIFSSVENIEL